MTMSDQLFNKLENEFEEVVREWFATKSLAELNCFRKLSLLCQIEFRSCMR